MRRAPISIDERLRQPTPGEVRAARRAAGLTQAEAARLVSPAKIFPYRVWSGYETDESKPNHRAIPLSAWELFLLLTDQHPRMRLVDREPG